MNYRNGRGRGGRGGRGGRPGGRFGFRGGRGGRGGGRGRGRGRNPREAAQSGNKRERISVESGQLVFIDQFMLANPQFLEEVKNSADAAPERRDELIQEFGGCVLALEPGMYRIERDPFEASIIVHPEGDQVETGELSRDSTESVGRVFVDTRCLAMFDRELLDDTDLLQRYQDLWFKGEEKACRDLLRDNGGAVRYGFQRYGDELGVYARLDEGVVCLWPEVVEESTQESVSEVA